MHIIKSEVSLPKKQASLAKGVALRSAPRSFAAGEQFDTRSVRSVFSDVHAAGENDQNYFLPAGKKLCEAFFDSLSGFFGNPSACQKSPYRTFLTALSAEHFE